MKEDFLHYLWKFKKFDVLNLVTTDGQKVEILNCGTHNTQNSGPDFFNAKLQIGNQTWAGNVEIHLKSSDWYAHQHQKDLAYDNVILHVVWEDDVEVFRKDNTVIATLKLSDFASAEALKNYRKLLERQDYKWINCEKDLKSVSSFTVENWIERLYIERLQEKSIAIENALKKSKNDWEAVCFQLLAKNFGLNINGVAFFKMASIVPFSIIRKTNKVETLEALFYGLLNMIPKDEGDVYTIKLRQDFDYLQKKYQLDFHFEQVEYFRLRPPNFPTIRLSQLATLYANTPQIFMQLMEARSRGEIHKLLKVEVSNYWKTHFTFGKESKRSTKVLSSSFIDLLIINTIVPLKFHYKKLKGDLDLEDCLSLLKELPKEQNSIIQSFNVIRPKIAISALESQALLHLKPNYCDKNRCLQCEIGLSLLKKKV